MQTRAVGSPAALFFLLVAASFGESAKTLREISAAQLWRIHGKAPVFSLSSEMAFRAENCVPDQNVKLLLSYSGHERMRPNWVLRGGSQKSEDAAVKEEPAAPHKNTSSPSGTARIPQEFLNLVWQPFPCTTCGGKNVSMILSI
eukprot:3824413-Rhodomonas_salina.1